MLWPGNFWHGNSFSLVIFSVLEVMYKFFLSIWMLFVVLAASAQRATDTFHLYFDLNVPALNHQAEKKIDLLIYNDKIINGSAVMIVGYADYLGTEGHNKALSMERAKNVKNYLIKYGVDENYIKLVEGKGEIHRSGARDRGGMPTDRRVDIVVNNGVTELSMSAGKLSTRPRKDTMRKVSTNVEDIKHLKAGSTMLLKNVYFPADRHTIKPESKETLEKLYVVLKDHPSLKISIEGHVCCIKDAVDALDIDTYEPTLSLNRARAIYYYLINKGIDSARLKYTGFGRRKPVIEDERTEEDAEKNRRVEIRVLENK
jgi:outer membrane protein OmpA-like peptidoglycan-associated protein